MTRDRQTDGQTDAPFHDTATRSGPHNKAATYGGQRRAHRGVRRPLFTQDDDEVFVTGSTLYGGDEGRSTPPDTTPLVITPFSAAVARTSKDRTRRVFLLKTDTIRYDTIR